jgi:hypothetical protein
VRRLLALAVLLLPASLYAQGAGTPAFRGQVLFPLTFSPDNTYDIGAAGATRPRTGHFGTSVITPALTVSGLTGGRVPIAGSGGLITDDADLTFDGARLSATSATVATQLVIPAGTTAATGTLMGNDTDTWLGSVLAGNFSFYMNGTERVRLGAGGAVSSTGGFAAGSTIAGADTALARHAANVWQCNNNAGSIRCLLGGGAAVASASALPVPTGAFFHVTGTTGITSQTLTNIGHGTCFTLVFDSTLTVTDGGNLKLNGNLSALADTTLGLCCDTTNCYETHRSIN